MSDLLILPARFVFDLVIYYNFGSFWIYFIYCSWYVVFLRLEDYLTLLLLIFRALCISLKNPFRGESFFKPISIKSQFFWCIYCYKNSFRILLDRVTPYWQLVITYSLIYQTLEKLLSFFLVSKERLLTPPERVLKTWRLFSAFSFCFCLFFVCLFFYSQFNSILAFSHFLLSATSLAQLFHLYFITSFFLRSFETIPAAV